MALANELMPVRRISAVARRIVQITKYRSRPRKHNARRTTTLAKFPSGENVTFDFGRRFFAVELNPPKGQAFEPDRI
jgi:hypothetical protein